MCGCDASNDGADGRYLGGELHRAGEPATPQDRGVRSPGPVVRLTWPLGVVDQLSNLDEANRRTDPIQLHHTLAEFVTEELVGSLRGVPQVDVRRTTAALIDGEGLLAQARHALESSAHLARDTLDSSAIEVISVLQLDDDTLHLDTSVGGLPSVSRQPSISRVESTGQPRYGNPNYFRRILRRHARTVARAVLSQFAGAIARPGTCCICL